MLSTFFFLTSSRQLRRLIPLALFFSIENPPPLAHAPPRAPSGGAARGHWVWGTCRTGWSPPSSPASRPAPGPGDGGGSTDEPPRRHFALRAFQQSKKRTDPRVKLTVQRNPCSLRPQPDCQSLGQYRQRHTPGSYSQALHPRASLLSFIPSSGSRHRGGMILWAGRGDERRGDAEASNPAFVHSYATSLLFLFPLHPSVRAKFDQLLKIFRRF